MKSVKASVFIVFLSLAIVYGCVGQDEMSLLHNRIATLEKELARQDEKLLDEERKSTQLEARMNELSKKDLEFEDSYRNRSAESQATLDQVREEIQTLRGKLEETDYAMRRQERSTQKTGGEEFSRLDQIEAVTQKNEDRLNRIEQYLNLEGSAAAPSKAVSEPKTPQATPEDALYQSAKKSFDAGEYENAREKFGAFLKKYPKSKVADNAQFWIGETYYREKWYEKAILEYQKVIENYPKGNKVPASLLKQGLSFLNLGDKSNCRLILKELVKKYPTSNEAKIAQQKLKDIE